MNSIYKVLITFRQLKPRTITIVRVWVTGAGATLVLLGVLVGSLFPNLNKENSIALQNLFLVAGGTLISFALLLIVPPEILKLLFLVPDGEDEISAIISKNLEDAKLRAKEEPEKAKPAWDIANATMQSYFNRNLGQVQSIYWVSILVMLAGVGLIFYGISLALQNPNNITPAIIGALAGIITEFIGATFLFIYRSTIEQAANYIKTLEKINNVGMAMQILDGLTENKEPDAQKEITVAKIEVAKLLLTIQNTDTPKNK